MSIQKLVDQINLDINTAFVEQREFITAVQTNSFHALRYGSSAFNCGAIIEYGKIVLHIISRYRDKHDAMYYIREEISDMLLKRIEQNAGNILPVLERYSNEFVNAYLATIIRFIDEDLY